MAVTLTQYGDWVFADDGFTCGIGWADARAQFTSTAVVSARAGSSPVISQGAISERTIPVKFHYSGTLGFDHGMNLLVGKLDPRDVSPRTLIGTMGAADGSAIVQRQAVVTLADGWDEQQDANTFYVHFTSDDPEWEAVTPTASGPYELNDAGIAAVPVPNLGLATVAPTITLTPGAFSHVSTSTDVGWRYLRTIAFTNNAPKTWRNRPLRLDLGATDAIVTAGKAQADGDDLRVLLDGEELPSTLIAWNYAQTYVWITPPPIAPGETVTFEIVYGNTSAVSPTVLEGQLHPSIIYEYDTGTATSGTTTTLVDSGKIWTSTDKNWTGAYVTFLSGANAGTTKEITAQTTTSVTFAAVGTAIAAGVKYLIAHSSNARWWYNTNEYFQSTSTPVRGRWYLNSKTKRPRVIDFSVPAAWAPFAMADNTDRFAQTSYSWLDKGGGSKPYAELDAYRTWAGGGPDGQLTSEDGQADGVAFSSCLPILKITSLLKLANNVNGMAQAVLMARAGGAESWETLDSVTANGTFTSAVTLPVDDDYYDLYQGLTPSDTEGVIRPDRAKDTGSTSADGSTRTTVTAASPTATQLLRKGPSASFPAVQDATPADITVVNSKTVERDGRRSGAWRGVIHTSVAGDEYKGWLPLSYLSGTDVGGDTIVDGSKNWIANELVGATLKITGSPNKTLNGKTAPITANTATTITVATGFAATVVQGTAYEIRQPKTTARLTDDQYTYLDFDSSLISVGALSAEIPVYQIATEIATGDVLVGTNSFPNAVIPGRSVRVRLGLDGRRLFLASGEALVLDGPTRTAKITTNSGATVKRTLTDPAVQALYTAWDFDQHAAVTVKSARWLPLPIGANQLTNGDAEGASLTPWTATALAGVTGTVTQDSSFKWAGAKSFKFTVTANTNGAATNDLLTLEYPKFAVRAGQKIPFAAVFFGGTTNLIPGLAFRWYDAGGALLGTTRQYLPGSGAHANWYPSSAEAIVYDALHPLDMPSGANAMVSPANTAQVGLVLTIYGNTANITGTAWFDAVDYGSPIITYAEYGTNKLNLAVSYRAGWLG